MAVQHDADGDLFEDSTRVPGSSWVVSTTVIIHNNSWSITLMDTADQKEIDRLLNLLSYTSDLLRPYAPEKPPPTQTEQPRRELRNGNGSTQTNGVWEIGRLLVVRRPGESRTFVQMFDVNEKLQYPRATVPSDMVIQLLDQRYGRDAFDERTLSRLETRDEEFRVTWEVHWVQSPKKPEYRDVSQIIIPKRERERENDTA